jgi:multidrug resistance efflux pump
MHRLLAHCFLVLPALAMAKTPPLMFTGEVFSRQSQEIIVPMTTTWKSQINRMAPEGSPVEPGQLVVEFDGTEAARQLEQQRETARSEQAKTELNLARLEKELAQARIQLQQAEVTLEIAKLKAEVPQGVIGGIEYAENQLSREEANNSWENASEVLADKQQLMTERRNQAQLDARKLELQEAWWSQMLDSFTIEARQSGYMLYGNHPLSRTKFQAGDTVTTGFIIARVADTSDLAIKIWINGVDKPRVGPGALVQVKMDALPARTFQGRIESISGSGEKRQEWGNADYFEGVVTLEVEGAGLLLPGMSAMVEVAP